jgi:hypothetical protein
MIGVVSCIQTQRYQFTWTQWLAPLQVTFLTSQEASSFKGKVIDHGGGLANADYTIPFSFPHLWHSDFKDIQQWRDEISPLPVGSSIPDFDFLPILFYLYARLDEYLPNTSDALGRFKASCAIQQQWMGVKIPYADYWRKELYQHLQLQDAFVPQKILTIDIDSAFAFINKGWYRTLGGFVKDILRRDRRNFFDRFKVVFLGKPDPYNTYDWLMEQSQLHGWELMYFMLVADFGDYDKGLPYNAKAFRQWSHQLAKSSHVAWHPGFASHGDIEKWKMEWSRIQKITRNQCRAARMHYLKMQMPQTYHRLLETGVSKDYTMGFAEEVGFRAGTSRTFEWYDWHNEKWTELQLIPFAYMEVTFKKYLKKKPEEAQRMVTELRQIVTESNGDWIVLWHNESVSDYREWEGWKILIEHTLKT